MGGHWRRSCYPLFHLVGDEISRLDFRLFVYAGLFQDVGMDDDTMDLVQITVKAFEQG